MTIFHCDLVPARRAGMRLTLAAVALTATSPASSYNLTKVMSGTPEAKYQSERPMFEVERCIVMLDLPAQPSVYRSPDKADESLVQFGVMTPMAVQLIRRSDTLEVIVWNGSKYAQRVKECAGA